ncbi:MAG TPA: ABC transporter ATP-binding protein [Saprospiraceae bacterium]|nr:ABC transporter ATP-binding protein [Saprospiraceae bacterium]MCB9268581.1 ABC transporter ATP-binding protein [Lewinellaceae bacterium]HPG08580.1 ABC transporter ATP-binding protein [Saprospiraceae bacterium]HPQ99562.1 ABC transporter ATP-binding protein [Saprospiraceae bacterium]HQU53748.1 ABC transporter ATP-binding protein [Saprospiraceae bacterium]
MSYNLNEVAKQQQKTSSLRALQKLLRLIREERKTMLLALLAIVTNSGLNLLAPFIIGHVIDTYVVNKDFQGVLRWGGILLVMYLIAFVANYLQTVMMGGVGQRMLFKLRNTIFNKLQELPVAFFSVNKAGDLISRVNNDSDKINQFFSQSLMQFIGTIVTMTGAGIFLLAINIELGVATLLPAVLIFLFTKFSSSWVKNKNAISMQRTGGLSAEIQESLQNFKVIVAFNRRDYFRDRFEVANEHNYTAALKAGIANNIFIPVYGLFAALAQLIVLVVGIHLISIQAFTIGLLVSYLAYAVNFYNPLRQLAALWANFQAAMASWDRISFMLNMENNMQQLDSPDPVAPTDTVIEFKGVSFGYIPETEILHHINFKLERGKTYALVGPTGGGKTTTASLIARLYDPTKGEVLLDGRDIRSFSPEERTRKIGFILQEPVLFSGTVRENIIYGNSLYEQEGGELEKTIREAGLQRILSTFDKGLDTEIGTGGESISLGQRQLIAFMRAVLRKPEILILDEATANIDTITEQVLEDILNHLPDYTTRVIIAHRLNTIQNADEIFFVNAGEMVRAGSFEHAVDMLLHNERKS